jgi:hypothetical protein
MMMNGKKVVFLMALLVVTVSTSSLVRAQTVELQNDGLVDNSSAGFQGGFAAGEVAAVVFHPENQDLPVTLQTVTFLFGGDRADEMFNIRISVWDEPGSGTSPSGEQVFTEEFQVTSNTMAFNEVDLSTAALTFNGPFRVGIEFTHNGFPAVARDADGNNFPNRNLIFAEGLGWVRSADLVVMGDWIVRATVRPNTGGTPTPDMEPSMMPDMTPDMVPDMQPEMTPDSDPEPMGLLVIVINPTQATNDADTDVTILGTGFTATTTFRVGSTQLQNLLVQSDTAALGVVPAGIVPGTYDVSANDQATGAQFVLSSGFTVVSPPTVTPPAVDDGCSTVGGRSQGAIPVFLLLVGLLFIRRRQR